MSLGKWSLLVLCVVSVGCGGASCDITATFTGGTDSSGDPWGTTTGGDISTGGGTTGSDSTGTTTGGDTTGADTSGSTSSGTDSTGSDSSGTTADSTTTTDSGIDSTGDGTRLSSLASGPQPPSTVRPNVAGDTYRYSVSGRSWTQNGAQNVALSGTATESFAAAAIEGRPVLVDTLSVAITIGGAQQVQILQRERRMDGVIAAESESGVPRAVQSGFVTLPASLNSSVAISSLELLANGASIAESYKVLGYGTLNEVAGSYACWCVRETLTYSNGTSVSKTIWLSPQLGGPVKETIHTLYRNGSAQMLVLRLQGDSLT